MARLDDWRAAWAARQARRLAEGERLAQIDRDVTADEVARQACMRRHPSRMSAASIEAEPLVTLEERNEVTVAEVYSDVSHGDPVLKMLPIYRESYPDDYLLPQVWLHTEWDNAWLEKAAPGGASW